MRVHSVLPSRLAAAVEAGRGALEHVAHPAADPKRAAEAAAADPDALALIGPFRSREVAEVVEATAPERLPPRTPASWCCAAWPAGRRWRAPPPWGCR